METLRPLCHSSAGLGATPLLRFVRALEQRRRLSGQVALDPATGKLVAGDIGAQTEQIFANISAVLEAAEKSFDDVMKTTVYLADMRDFGAMNTVYARYFQTPFPARTTIQAAGLPLGAAVEIEVVAR